MRAVVVTVSVVLTLACGSGSGEPPCTPEALTQAAISGGAMAAGANAKVTDYVCFRENARASFELGGEPAVGLFEWDGFAWKVADLGSAIDCPWSAEVCTNLRMEKAATPVAAEAPAPKLATPTAKPATTKTGGATCFSYANDGQETHYTFEAGCYGYGCEDVSGAKCERVCAKVEWEDTARWTPKAEVDGYDFVVAVGASECGGAEAPAVKTPAATRAAPRATGGTVTRTPSGTTTTRTSPGNTTSRPKSSSGTGNTITRTKR